MAISTRYHADILWLWHFVWRRYASIFVLSVAAKTLGYSPWGAVCSLVRNSRRGAQVLFPQKLELVVFRRIPPRLSRVLTRYSPLCAFHHAMIFLALVVALLWYKAAVGVPVACGLMSRFMYVWTGFQVDSNIPLGLDDRQSLYLLAKGTAFENQTVLS
jgi:hypothetical protein